MTLLEIYDEYTHNLITREPMPSSCFSSRIFVNCLRWQVRTTSACAYLAATSSGRFPLPASVRGTARNFLLKTAAISYWIHARESLLRFTARTSSWRAIATGRALYPTKLCGKPQICAVGLFIFVIPMRDFFFLREKTRLTAIESILVNAG